MNVKEIKKYVDMVWFMLKKHVNSYKTDVFLVS
jgi:hypothetical protein